MNIWYRMLTYALLWGAGTAAYMAYVVMSIIAESKHDPSAGAILGFLPFLIPIFMMEVGKWVGAGAATIELVLLAWRATRKG